MSHKVMMSGEKQEEQEAKKKYRKGLQASLLLKRLLYKCGGASTQRYRLSSSLSVINNWNIHVSLNI